MLTINLGNILSIATMVTAVVIFVVSIHFTNAANKESIRELKGDMKEIKFALTELQKTVSSIDKRLAVMEARMESVDQRVSVLESLIRFPPAV